MTEKIKDLANWYWNTSALVGVPVLFILLVILADKSVSTVVCQVAGKQCDRAIGALPTNVKIDLPGFTYSGDEEGKPEPKKKSG